MKNMESIRDKANDAMWSVIASEFPEAMSGDFPPGYQRLLDAALEEAISRWTRINLPRLKAGTRVVMPRGVDAFPDFLVPSGATGVVVTHNRRGLFVKLDDPPAGSEEWDGCVIWDVDSCDNWWEDVEVID